MVVDNILITGATGLLGKELVKILKDKFNNINLHYPTSKKLNILNLNQLQSYFANNKIDLVIHCAAYTDTKRAEIDLINCMNVNIVGTCNVVSCCAENNIKLVYISTDHVFDGEKGDYINSDYVNPISKYAKSKTAGEFAVKMYDNSLIIRTSFFGDTFPHEIAFCDQWTTKDYIDVMAPKILDVCLSNIFGVFHCASQKRTLYDLAIQRKPKVKKAYRHDYNREYVKDTSLIQT